jgi:hypothetical protein
LLRQHGTGRGLPVNPVDDLVNDTDHIFLRFHINQVPPELRVPAPVATNGDAILRVSTTDEVERTGHDAKPALHAFCFMENNDTVLDFNRLFPAIIRARPTAGAESGIADRLLDAGDPYLVEPLALAAVRAGRYSDPNFYREFFTKEFLIDFPCEADAVNDAELSVTVPEAGGDIYHFFPLCTEWRAICREIVDKSFEFFRVNMRELHCLTGGKVDVLDPVPGCDLSHPLHLGGRQHTGRHAEADNTEIGIAFGNDPPAGVNVLFDS